MPSHHPVYDWLYHQRISGNLPYYNYESLPLKRNEIASHLRSLKESGQLSRTQQITLDSYLKEFNIRSYPDETVHQFLLSRDSSGFHLNRDFYRKLGKSEMHLFKLGGQEHFGWVDFGVGNRFMNVTDGDESYRSPVSIITKVRVIGGYRDKMGLHFEYDFVTPSLDNLNTFFYDNYYSSNWWIWRKKTMGANDGNNLSHFESYATVAPFSALDLSIGHGNLKIGTGDYNNLLFSRNSVPITWFQLNLGTDWIRYKMIHGTLGWPTTTKEHPDYPNLTTKNSPRRFIRLSQLKLQPFDWLDVQVYEMINYANRGYEVDYLHPFNILSMAQHNLFDQDNTMGGGLVTIRPVRRMELSAEILIDDMVDAFEVFKRTKPETSRFARKFTFNYMVHSDLRFITEYNRIDPFVYSHPYGLNAHTQLETVLGSQLPPNSDQLTIGFRYHLPLRSWVDIRLSRVRNGQSIYDDEGTLQVNAGENANIGRNKGQEIDNDFLGGDPHRWINLTIDSSWELKRAIILKGRFEQRWVQLGNQVNDQQIFWVDLIVGM